MEPGEILKAHRRSTVRRIEAAETEPVAERQQGFPRVSRPQRPSTPKLGLPSSFGPSRVTAGRPRASGTRRWRPSPWASPASPSPLPAPSCSRRDTGNEDGL